MAEDWITGAANVTCGCGKCKPEITWYGMDIASPKEDQKAKVEATPVLKQPFECRVLELAVTVWRSRPMSGTGYTWSDALRDATDIILAAEFEEIAND